MNKGSRVWAVVPVKALANAKMRLADVLSANQRSMLARAMLQDVLSALTGCRSLDDIIVVSADAEAARVAHEFDAKVLPEPASGLNAAIGSAVEFIGREPGTTMLVVPADVPHITAAIVDTAVTALNNAGSVVLVRATRDGGTNLFGCNPASALQPSFGPDSYARHRSTAEGLSLHVASLHDDALGLDLDQPADLEGFLTLHSLTRTDRLLRDWKLDTDLLDSHARSLPQVSA